MTPYFYIKQKQKAALVIDDAYAGHRMTFLAWKIFRAWYFTVTCPEFVDVDLYVFRHLEEAFRMMINHAAKSIGSQRAVGGGVGVDADWSKDNTVAVLCVFPRSEKYVIVLERDDLGNVTITSPRMTFSDIPSMNQALRVCGQVVQIATSMGR